MPILINNQLSFDVIETNNCKTIALLDTSVYQDPNSVEGKVLQVQPPNGLDIVELNYLQSAVTILNSNSIGLTAVSDFIYLQDLPDGLYTAKISVCPYETNWAEKKWYRTCQIKCKFYQMFLKTKLSACDSCSDLNTNEKLKQAWEYITGVEANVTVGNFVNAAKLYTVANTILDNLLECDCA